MFSLFKEGLPKFIPLPKGGLYAPNSQAQQSMKTMIPTPKTANTGIFQQAADVAMKISEAPSRLLGTVLSLKKGTPLFQTPAPYVGEKIEEGTKRIIKDTPIKQIPFLRTALPFVAGQIAEFGTPGLGGEAKGLSKLASEFKGFEDITTKVLDRLKGKSIASKQQILDFTNMPELKQAERDLIRNTVNDFGDKIPVQDFANRVKLELLPLKVGKTSKAYESTTLPDELRGPIANYERVTYESPIKTSAGKIHPELGKSDNYFAHVGREDLPTEGHYTDWSTGKATKGKPVSSEPTRRVIEIQSDLFQKGRLEKESGINIAANQEFFDAERQRMLNNGWTPEEISKWEQESKIIKSGGETERMKEISKLEPYRNAWQDRIIREEVKQAAKDGKTKLQFPTGETAMKIEGLGETRNPTWFSNIDDRRYPFQNEPDFIPANAKDYVGMEIYRGGEGSWIITDVLGDGKFKAVPKDVYKNYDESGNLIPKEGFISDNRPATVDTYVETFDISGKVDTENPIYKFYEKEVGRFLKNKYNAQLITDAQGVKWWQVDIKKEVAKEPVQAYGHAKLGTVIGGALTAIAGTAGFQFLNGINQNRMDRDNYETMKYTAEHLTTWNELNHVRDSLKYLDDAAQKKELRGLIDKKLDEWEVPKQYR